MNSVVFTPRMPMLGFGLNGLWAAYHADFPSRETFEDRSGL